MADKIERMTFKSFDYEEFKRVKRLMEDFRINCHDTPMESIWETIKESYIPNNDELQVYSKYSLNDDGTATPDRLFVDNDDERLDLQEALVAVKVHTGLSLLTHRTPDVKWDSDNEDYESLAPILNAVRQSDWDDPQVRQQYVMLWFYDIMYGTTFWHRFYERNVRSVNSPTKINLGDDSVEYEDRDVVDFDGVTAEALSPFDVWIDPATEPMKPRSMRKVMWKKTYDYQSFLRQFSDIVSEKKLAEVTPTTADDGREHTDSKMVTCEYFEDMDLDLYYVVANDVEIIKDHMPANHKQLSIMMSVWMPREDGKNPYGVGPIELMLPDKRLLDKFKSMTITQAMFSIYKAVFYSGTLEGDGEGGDLHIRPDRAYKMLNPKDLTFYDMPGPGQDAWKTMEYLRTRVDDSSGINRPLGGEIVKTTAFQTDLAKDAALARMSVPIDCMVSLLSSDAYLTFELERQYYALPTVEPIVDPDKIEAARNELERLKASGKPAAFDLWLDIGENGELEAYKANYRTAQLNVDKTELGGATPTLGKKEIVLTPEVFDWKGKVRVVADSILAITPTMERTRKLELYNLLIPLFAKPPELVAKPAKALCRLYEVDINDVLPDAWLAYLKQTELGLPPPPQPTSPDMQNGQPGRPREFGAAANGAMNFEQERADKVVSNIGGQKDMISAASEQISP